MSTPYHAKYYAHELTKQCSADRLQKLNQSIFNATVDLNPHQIDAALFAFRSPLSRGAVLADEVGLGKTIEAGLIISQIWAERKRRILCILPAALREQWSREMMEKFFIDSVILETKAYNRLVDEGVRNPFERTDRLVLCSYQFARAKEADVQAVPWDLVVIDEAHRMRNVYKKSNKIARSILDAVGGRPKVLLTATPLQNSLMELYGLVSFVDPHIFGGEDSFREQFAKRVTEMSGPDFQNLRNRIRPICQRTLRRQVREYIKYTKRVSMTQDFTPTDDEIRLYDGVSTYLQRPTSFALPSSQRSLMVLVLRKILASSSFAIAATLGTLIDRLEAVQQEIGAERQAASPQLLGEDFEVMDELQEEWSGDDNETEAEVGETGGLTAEEEKRVMHQLVRREIADLKSYRELATSITRNAKGEALLVALRAGFQKAEGLGAPRKALIFTESRRTQAYLRALLESNGYQGQVVTLNGTNSEPQSTIVYREWLKRHAGHDCIKGTRSVDVRSALVEEFQDRASIMIATESGAEGINLQFCSLVVNYDLPWNPQRIEQRIGRCHRYGQKHDVVVINFINRKNAADQRVFEILSEKFRLFDGVFGASDEVLGVLESGVDFEKRINAIYQSCRTPEEINAAFDRLQAELDEDIQARMNDTRSKLLEHFDEEVHVRLRDSLRQTDAQIGQFGEWLWRLTQYELGRLATFSPDAHAFELYALPDELRNAAVPLGRYRLITDKNGADDHQYRLGHPLAEHLVAQAKSRELPVCEVVFKYSQHPSKVSVVENLQGQAGWLLLSQVAVEALEREDHLVFSGLCDDGTVLDAEICGRLFAVGGETGDKTMAPPEVLSVLRGETESAKSRIVSATAERNKQYFEAEMEKLEAWAEDLKENLERELKEMDREVKALKKEARQATDLDAKVELHRKAKDLERRRNEKRRSLFEAQDDIDTRKELLITEVESRLKQQVSVNEVFTIRWRVA